MSRDAAAAHGAMIAARPTLQGCGPFGSFRDLPGRVLLHAGPPYSGPEQVPQPVLNSAVSAVLAEGWATTADAARAMIASREIPMQPAQDHGMVTPLAFVATPGTPVLRVVDAAGIAPDRFCPVNDGPGDAALRFGGPPNAPRLARLAAMRDAAPGLDAALSDGVPVLPLMTAGIAAGDDLHGNVAGMTEALAAALLPRLDGAAHDYVAAAPLFGLNAIMGACAVLFAAAAASGDSDTIIAAGGNGVDFGWQRADRLGVWQRAAALPPIGPLFTDIPASRVLPAIGDSAVIDACGFGGAILRHAPALRAALAPFHDESAFALQASAAFSGPHPVFPADIRVGLRSVDLWRHPGIMLGMLDMTGDAGLIGRGLAPWPTAAGHAPGREDGGQRRGL